MEAARRLAPSMGCGYSLPARVAVSTWSAGGQHLIGWRPAESSRPLSGKNGGSSSA